jgi:hypothetical protein
MEHFKERMQGEYSQDLSREEVEIKKLVTKKVVKLKSFYSHALLYLAGIVVYVLKTYFEAPFNFFPLQYINGFVMAIWTTAFLVSAVDLFATYKIFGEEWEERKMKSILDKKTKKQKWE